MKNATALFFALLMCQGCAIVSKQYYYIPSVPHQTVKTYFRHSDFKMRNSKFKISGAAGDSVGSIVMNNGSGHPLLMGPVLPVIPVGGFFEKSTGRFIMDLAVNCNEGYFMPLSIDSSDYKRIKDSLNVSISTQCRLPYSQCYMIVNDTLKIPLKADEVFMNHTHSHSYWLTADVRFREVRSLKLVTGNPLLDSTLKHITFTRKSRIKVDLLGPGY